MSNKKDFQDQMLRIVDRMNAISIPAGEATAIILGKMEILSDGVLSGNISVETAEASADNYMHAMDMVLAGIKNEADVDSYLKEKELLEYGKRVALLGLRVGLQIAAPGSTALLSGIGELAFRRSSSYEKPTWN